MKFILSVLLITVTSAIPIENEKYAFHYVQHQSSVDNARQRMSQRLSELQGAQGSQRLQSGYTLCSTCPGGYTSAQSQSLRSSSSQASSMQSSGSSANIVEGSDYVGVGYVGHAADDLQARVGSNYGSQSRFSSSNALNAYEEEDEYQQRQIVPDINDNYYSSAYRSSGINRDDTQSNIGYHDLSVTNDRNLESYSHRRQQQEESETSRTVSKPSVYFVPAPSVTSSNSQRASESSNQHRVSMAVRPGTSTVIRVPLTVVPQTQQQYTGRTHTGSSYQASGTETIPTYTVYYVPSTSYDNRYATGSQHDASRTSVVQPEKYRDFSAYNSFNTQSRSQNEDVQESESYQTRVNPSTITDGGASRYSSGSSSSNLNQQASRVVRPLPAQTYESSSLTAQRTEEEQRQRTYSPARPNYVQRTSEQNRNEESRSESSRTESTNIYTPVVTSQQSHQRQSQGQQQSQYSSRTGNNYSPYSPSYPSSRLGSGVTYSNSDNLLDYMSESERLARLQQQQVSTSQQTSSRSSASEASRRVLEQAQRLDSAAANFVGSSNLASRNSEFDAESLSGVGVGTGGYQRVKSWQKQSAWESGSQYGSDGKPTTFSKLSTAEAEKHNINGAEAGYKAATTTLENDGKVSTYSIHT